MVLISRTYVRQQPRRGKPFKFCEGAGLPEPWTNYFKWQRVKEYYKYRSRRMTVIRAAIVYRWLQSDLEVSYKDIAQLFMLERRVVQNHIDEFLEECANEELFDAAVDAYFDGKENV